MASYFSDEMTYMKKNDKYGYMNTEGKEITDIIFDNAYSFDEGLAKVIIDKSFAYIDNTGKYIVPLRVIDDYMKTWSYDSDKKTYNCNFWSWKKGTALMYIVAEINGNASLEFSWSHKYNSKYPKDKFMISVAGKSILWEQHGSDFDSEQGKSFFKETVNLSGYSGKVAICFEGVSGFGPNLNVKDIRIIENKSDIDFSVHK